MRLTAKVVGVLLAIAAAIQLADGWWRMRRERAQFEHDMTRDTRLVGEVVAPMFARIWATDGKDAALAILRASNREAHHQRLRWVEGADAATQTRPDAVVATVPIEPTGHGLGAVEVRESWGEERAYLARSKRNAVIVTLALSLGFGASALATSVIFVGRPVRRLVERARRVGRGDLSPAPPSTSRDELGLLAVELDSMCAGLARALEQLRHADRLTTVGKLASGIAHELGTPLNVVGGRAQMIASGDAEGAEARESARIIEEQAQRMTGIIRQLLDFSRRGGAARARLDLIDLVQRTARLLQTLAGKKQLELATPPEGAPAVEVTGNGAELGQVVTNLLTNAIHATDRGTITIAVDIVDDVTPPPELAGARGPFACVSVRDPGRGMTPDELAHAFEPFFTTKGVGEGTGLGLSVAYGIVRDHGGWITAESRAGEGSVFRLYLPRAA